MFWTVFHYWACSARRMFVKKSETRRRSCNWKWKNGLLSETSIYKLSNRKQILCSLLYLGSNKDSTLQYSFTAFWKCIVCMNKWTRLNIFNIVNIKLFGIINKLFCVTFICLIPIYVDTNIMVKQHYDIYLIITY